VFVVTQGDGAFHSTDNAETWTGINNGLTATNVRALAISPVDHILAGTFGGVFAGTADGGTGMYRSTDNGDSWTPANISLTSTDVAALAVNGSNYHVFAGTHSIIGKGGWDVSIH
jgi:hypothetical protein